MILAPDHLQRHIYTESILPNLKDGDALFFGHGFNIRFGYIKPSTSVDVAMVAAGTSNDDIMIAREMAPDWDSQEL